MFRTASYLGMIFMIRAIAAAAPLPTSSPSEAGLTSDGLARIETTIAEHIAANRVAGATALIARHGKVAYFEVFGDMDREKSKPMTEDAIFRIYSMTKAVTGVAIMILVDEGKIALDDPLAKHLGEFADMKVAVATDEDGDTPTVELVDAERAITILDLMRHTSGINYDGPKDAAGESYYATLGVRDPDANLEVTMRRLAKAPLVHQPGTIWDYGYSIDVLGRVVEVVAKMPLDQFFEERIFAPLGMVDSGFHVPEKKWDRLVTLYAPNEDRTIARSESAAQDQYKHPAVRFSGGGGLVSTTMDYARFCQMLLSGGELDGRRVLSQTSVDQMRTDLLRDMPRVGALLGKERASGFGLTFAIVTAEDSFATKGTYRWGGAAGTRFWIDPEKDMFGLFMVNILPHTGLTYGDDFGRMVYEAIEE